MLLVQEQQPAWEGNQSLQRRSSELPTPSLASLKAVLALNWQKTLPPARGVQQIFDK